MVKSSAILFQILLAPSEISGLAESARNVIFRDIAGVYAVKKLFHAKGQAMPNNT